MTLPHDASQCGWSRVETVGSHELGIAMLARGWHCDRLEQGIFHVFSVGPQWRWHLPAPSESGLDALPERVQCPQMMEFLPHHLPMESSTAKDFVLRSYHLHRGCSVPPSAKKREDDTLPSNCQPTDSRSVEEARMSRVYVDQV